MIEILRKYFRYEPDTGLLYRIRQAKTGKRVDLSKPVGTEHSGYLFCSVPEGIRTKPVHVICYALQTGELPEVVDHKDGNGLNNKWYNLRNGTQTQNRYNSKAKSSNTTGVKGLFEYAPKGRKPLWKASIKVDGVSHQKYFPYTGNGRLEAIEWLDEQRHQHGEFANKGN